MRYFALSEMDKLGPFTREELAQLATDGAQAPETQLIEESGEVALDLKTLLASVQAVRAAAVATTMACTDSSGPRAETATKPAPAAPTVLPWLWTALLGALGLYLLLRRPPWFMLDWLNLPIHEAGHLIFSYDGEFLHYLGGTIAQLLVPALVAGYFMRARRTAGIQFGLFWLGQSCLDVSVYAADARALRLELLGGGDHDWNYMLYELGLLEHDQTVAAVFVALAAAAFLALVCWPFVSRWTETTPSLSPPAAKS